MNAVFAAMMLCGVAFAMGSGCPERAQAALLSGGGEAIALCLSLAGTYAFFGGMLGILREAGAADTLAALLARPVRRLLCMSRAEETALPDICMNLSANMLGLGGAATPAGLRAMERLARAAPPDGNASRAMIAFLVINTTSVQLLPTTMIALRAQAGAANPADIVLPTLLSTATSTLTGVLACRAFERMEAGR